MKKIRAVGGGAHSKTLLQIKTDIFEMPVETLIVSEAGTLGLAILSAVSCEDYTDYASAIDSMVKVDHTFLPIKNNKAIYEKKYKQFTGISSAMKNFYHIKEE